MAIPREVGKQKKLTNTRELAEYKQTLQLNQIQKEFLYGTLLGDGCLITSCSGKSARLQVRHQRKYTVYVMWKYQLFRKWVISPPKYDSHNDSCYFRTISHPNLMTIKKIFYKGIKRVIPENISDLFMSPLSLAIWAMDDGNGFKDRVAFRFNSYGFGQKGNKLLQLVLQKNFSLKTSIYNDSKGYVLYLNQVNTIQLYNFIKPYLHPCMNYKFASLTP